MQFRDFHRQSGTDSISTPRLLMRELPGPVKSYARFEQVTLPKPQPIATSLSEAAAMRMSGWSFDQQRSLTLQELSDILSVTMRVTKRNTTDPQKPPQSRTYPSGGGLFPIECYIAPLRVEGLDTAHIYHYDPDAFALAMLPEKQAKAVHAATEGGTPVDCPAAILILTSVWQRSYKKYGEFSYRLALAEAGHIAQNALLAAAAKKITARPIMGFNAEKISEALHIDADEEDPLYLIFLGH